MNFIYTMKSVELVLKAKQVPLLIGETGIGKTSLATAIAKKNDWHLVTIDGNLLKEGEIGGLPTVDTFFSMINGKKVRSKRTVYAIHHVLQEIESEVATGKEVLLFIDEVNRCEHAVQQELMNLVLNRKINGYQLPKEVHILAAMNPVGNYDYQTVDMDVAQQNRFVWLYMEVDYLQWIHWAMDAGIDDKVVEFISTYPEYLNTSNEDDIHATPRSYERISEVYRIYKEDKEAYPRDVFYQVIRGNVGKVVAEQFMSFIETYHEPLLSYEEVFSEEVLVEDLQVRIQKEGETRLYLGAKNILRQLERNITKEEGSQRIDRLMAFLELYPVDLRMALLKELRNYFPKIYEVALEIDSFIECFFSLQRSIRG